MRAHGGSPLCVRAARTLIADAARRAHRCTEVGKLGISVYQYFTAVRRDQGAAFQPSRGEFGWILVPSIVYAVANNLQMLVRRALGGLVALRSFLTQRAAAHR